MKNIAIKHLFALGIGVFCMKSALAVLPVQQWTQASGAQVFLVESPAIPMLDVQIDFDAGSRRDPAAQAGLASAMAALMSRGIAASGAEPAFDENQLAEAWTDLGAQFGASAGSDRLGFSLRTLTRPDLLDRAVSLAARQMAQPAFPADIWQRERERLGADLREARTRPAHVAGLAFARAVYGDHPYGYEVTEATLARISVDDLRASHRRDLRACGARVSLVGAVSRQQADALVRRLLAHLPATGCGALPSVPEVSALAAPQTLALPFESAQAHVLIGQPGMRRADPDFFALFVGNHILGGGGFVSRLTEEVRERRGLSYSVYSYFAPGRHAGAFTIGLQTRPDQAPLAVQVSQDVLRRFVAEGPTEAELQAAKDNLIGGFALRVDSNRKLLDNVANIAWNGLPLDYLDRWTDRVGALTTADIRTAFARIIQPERLVTVVVGGAAR